MHIPNPSQRQTKASTTAHWRAGFGAWVLLVVLLAGCQSVVLTEPVAPPAEASIIGAEIPVWDIREHFGETDMLVRQIEQGRHLATTLGDNTCLLMRGHGAVVVGESIGRAVLTAVYLQVNANVLMEAKSLGEPAYLSDEEIRLSTETQFSPLAVPRAWEYFCQRAGVDPV